MPVAVIKAAEEPENFVLIPAIRSKKEVDE